MSTQQEGGKPSATPFSVILQVWIRFDFPREPRDERRMSSELTSVASVRFCDSFFSGGKKALLLLSGIQGGKKPPTKRTRTWGARAEEKPLRLKFRNKKMTFPFELLFPDVTL